MIIDTLQKQIVEAMKAKNSIRVSTLRILNSELKNAKIDNKGELTEEIEINVVRREAKKRKDSIEAFEKGGRVELAEKEKKELEILREFLPPEMSDEKLEMLVDEAIKEAGASGLRDMGKVMPVAIEKTAGNADGKKVADLVKRKLSH